MQARKPKKRLTMTVRCPVLTTLQHYSNHLTHHSIRQHHLSPVCLLPVHGTTAGQNQNNSDVNILVPLFIQLWYSVY